MSYYTATARRIDSLMMGLTDDQIGEIMQVIGVGAEPSIRRIAAVIGKSPSTVQRWQRTNPELFRAVSEYVARKDN
jgi:IS30 family transposase